MTNPIRPGIDHTRVPSSAAMRARDVSRDPEAEALGLRAGRAAPKQPAEEQPDEQLGGKPHPPPDRSDS